MAIAGFVARFLATLAGLDGRLLAADESPIVAEGTWDHQKVVLLEFRDVAEYERWATSPAYTRIAEDRRAATPGRALVVSSIGAIALGHQEGDASSMPMLDHEMKRVVDEQRLGYVATVGPDGTPNLSPKGTTAVWDDEHLVFAHLHSHQTVANIEGGNPIVEINVVDPIRRKGYRFKGAATVHREGAVYESGLDFYRQRSGLDPRRVAAIVLVRVEHAAPIISPAYDDGSTEEAVEQRSLRLYRLRRVEG
jgi:uncharacterized protein (DUF1330 family)